MIQSALSTILWSERKQFTSFSNLAKEIKLFDLFVLDTATELLWSQNKLMKRWHESVINPATGAQRGRDTAFILSCTNKLYTLGYFTGYSFPWLTALPASIDAVLYIKSWLDERDSRAKFAEWQTRPARPRDPAWRQPVAGEDAAARETRYARWLAARSPA